MTLINLGASSQSAKSLEQCDCLPQTKDLEHVHKQTDPSKCEIFATYIQLRGATRGHQIQMLNTLIPKIQTRNQYSFG
jgi:hypothetical protein